MNNIELNAILYYADFLSMKHRCHPVTDNCKYFFIHGAPINSAFIVDLEPIYDDADIYFQQALQEYTIIKDKSGEEGVESFIDDICSIKACGSVSGEQMLQCIHQFNNKKERKHAFIRYYDWLDNQKYTHTIKDEDGKPQEKECTKYFYHAERLYRRPKLASNV